MIFDDFSYLVQGDKIPDLNLLPADKGQDCGIKKGQILLLSFFIIKCKHCKHMLEYLQKELWPEFRESNRMLLIVGRGHTPGELLEFKDKGNYSLPFTADPDMKNYDLFAEKKVPRNYLFDSKGLLLFQTRGFDLDQLWTLKMILQEMEGE